MADLYPNIRFPSIDFSPLARLPETIDAAQRRAAEKTALADLPENASISEMRAAANRLAQSGNLESATRLYTAAQARETSDIARQRSALDAAVTGAILGRMNQPSALPSRAGAAEAPTATVPSPTVAPPAADPFAGVPGAVPVPGPGASLQLTPSPQLPPSPGEQTLAAAEGAPGLPVPPLTQLAGPPPTPNTTPGPVVPQVQPWMTGAAPAPQPSATPVTAPVVQRPSAASPQQQAMNEVDAITQQMQGIVSGKGISRAGELAAANSRLRDAIDRAKPTKEQREFIEENARRAQSGEPLFRNEQEMQLAAKTAFPTFESAMKYADQYRTKEQEAIRTGNAVEFFQKILSHPAFEPGKEGIPEYFNEAKARARNFKDLLVANGFIDPKGDIAQGIDRATASVPLREAMTALQSQLVISGLGGLGSGRSDKDVVITMLTQPGVAMSKPGSEILTEYMKQQSDNAKAIGGLVREYMAKTQHNAKPYEVDKIARDYEQSHGIFRDSNGNPTALGKRVDSLLNPTATSAPATSPAPVGRRVKGPDGKIYNSLEEAQRANQ
jgi:hypothetical protein